MATSCIEIACGFSDTISVLATEGLAQLGRLAADTDRSIPGFWAMAAGATGSILASFSGLVADRLPRMKGWGDALPDDGIDLSSPPSHCDACKHRLSTISLIPVVGWLASSGRCRHCGSAVPAVYPIVEGGSFVASAALVLLAGPTMTAFALCICLWWLTAVSWLDWKAQEIPDFLTVPLFFVGLLMSPIEPDIWARALGAAVSGAFIGTAFALTSRIKDVDTMSYGDVALSIALGAWLGGDGVLPFMIASAMSYLAYAVPLRLRGVLWVPMGPAISLGFLIVAVLNPLV